MHSCKSTCAHVYAYAHAYVRACARTHKHVHQAHMSECVCVPVCTCLHRHARVFVRPCAWACVGMHACGPCTHPSALHAHTCTQCMRYEIGRAGTGQMHGTTPAPAYRRLAACGVLAIELPWPSTQTRGEGRNVIINSHNFKPRVSNPRTVAHLHFNMPFGSSNLPGAGPISSRLRF